MANITLISGSTLGSAEYVAEHLAEKLDDAREYDTFCGAIDKLEAELKACGAKQIGETLRINVLEHEIPEDPAEIWLGSWHPLLRDL